MLVKKVVVAPDSFKGRRDHVLERRSSNPDAASDRTPGRMTAVFDFTGFAYYNAIHRGIETNGYVFTASG
jgi:hypothetical protein